MVVSNMFYFHPYLGKIPILTSIFQLGWFNHQLDMLSLEALGPGYDSHQKYDNSRGLFFLQKSPQLGGMRVNWSYLDLPFGGSWEWMGNGFGVPIIHHPLRVSTQHPFTGRCWICFSTGDLPGMVFSDELFGVPANILTPVSSTFMFRAPFATG